MMAVVGQPRAMVMAFSNEARDSLLEDEKNPSRMTWIFVLESFSDFPPAAPGRKVKPWR
jgi:hypothetical protein